jgi:hypothetical protein
MEHMLRQMSHLTRTKLSHAAVDHTCEVDAKEPPLPKSNPRSGLLFTVDYYSKTDARQLVPERVAAFDTRAPLAAGDHYAGLVSGTNVVSAVSLPGDPAYARAYAPGKATVDIQVPAPLPTRVRLFVPDGAATNVNPELIELSGLSGVSLLDATARQKLAAAMQ